MKNTLLALACPVVLAVLAGCATVQTSRNFNGCKVEKGRTPIETVEISNDCWLLFGAAPIASGDPTAPNMNSSRFFRNCATLQNNLVMLDREAERVGATGRLDVKSSWEDESVFFVLLSRKTFHTSAVLVKDAEK